VFEPTSSTPRRNRRRLPSDPEAKLPQRTTGRRGRSAGIGGSGRTASSSRVPRADKQPALLGDRPNRTTAGGPSPHDGVTTSTSRARNVWVRRRPWVACQAGRGSGAHEPRLRPEPVEKQLAGPSILKTIAAAGRAVRRRRSIAPLAVITSRAGQRWAFWRTLEFYGRATAASRRSGRTSSLPCVPGTPSSHVRPSPRRGGGRAQRMPPSALPRQHTSTCCTPCSFAKAVQRDAARPS